MNELPIMPIRAKYADETTKGINIDDAIESGADDTAALALRVGGLETTVGDSNSGLVKKVTTLEDKTQKISHSAGGTSVDGNLSAGVIYGSTSASSPSGAFDTLKCDILTSDESEISAQKPVVEVMSGYSYEAGTAKENFAYTPIYVGAVKNGNKLTIVWFGTIKRTGDVSYNYAGVGSLIIPSAVGNKLIPYSSEGIGQIISSVRMSCFTNWFTAPVQMNAHVIKNTDTSLTLLVGSSLADLTADTDYFVRLEYTFLLSGNLAA